MKKELQKETQKRSVKPALGIGAGILLYALGGAGISWGYARLYTACMEMWGVTSVNVQFAPWWILTIVYAGQSIPAVLQAAWAMGLVCVLRRLLKPSFAAVEGKNRPGMGAALGALTALLCAACLLMTDDLRMGRAMASPRVQASVAGVCIAILAEAVGREWFFRGFLYRLIRHRRFGMMITALFCVAIHGITGSFSVWYALNAGLVSVVLCMLYDKTGSLWTGIGFRAGLHMILTCLLGTEGSAYGLYELYYVSRAWLSGGQQGPMAGLMMTMLLALLIICMRKREERY